MTDIAELLSVAPPPEGVSPQFDWDAVEKRLNQALPSDYKMILDRYGEGSFWDNVHVGGPTWIIEQSAKGSQRGIELLHSLAIDHSPARLSRIGFSVQMLGVDLLGDMSLPPDEDEIEPPDWEKEGEDALESFDVAYGTESDSYLGVGWAQSGQSLLWRITDPNIPDSWPILAVGDNGMDYDVSGLGGYLTGLLSDSIPSCAFDIGWIDDCVKGANGVPFFRSSSN